MTKYEWESELKKNIHRLPADEIKRVIEYYDELFFDKAERGVSEKEIISEFGNPVDVAYKIMSEFDDNTSLAVSEGIPVPLIKKSREEKSVQEKVKAEDNTGKTVTPAPVPAATTADSGRKGQPVVERRLSGGRLAVFLVFAVIFGGIFVGVAICLWSIVFSVAVAGGACVAAGLVGIVPSCMAMAQTFSVGLVQLGICLAAAGIGALLILLTVKLVKLGIFLTKKCFHWTKLMVTEKKVKYEN